MDEGPHCDLREWKHYDSDWEKLTFDNKKGAFLTHSYSREDQSKFVPVEMEELKKAVAEFCSERWGNLLENVTSVNDYPCGVSLSRILLKIVLTDQHNETTERFIEFIIPMGC